MRLLSIYTLTNRRQRRNAVHRRRLPALLIRPLWIIGTLFSLLLVFFFLLSAMAYASLTINLPSVELLPVWLNPRNGLLLEPTRVYDRSGQRLLASIENPGVERAYLFLSPEHASHFSPLLVEMTVATYDPTFWHGSGVNWTHLLSPQPSTLAERLVSDLLLDQEPVGIRRALRAKLLAAQVIKQYGHAQVLEWTLNSMYYGHQAYGAESAARLYLDKSARELNLAEVALLLATAQSPALNPLDAPAAAFERQQILLGEWHARHLISDQEYEQAKQTTISPRLPKPETPQIARAFTHQVINQMIAALGRQRVERGGLRIITTLDYDLQTQLTCALRTQLLRLEDQMPATGLPDDANCKTASLLPTIVTGSRVFPSELQASAVILDLASGEVLAMLGDTSVLGESETLSSHDPGSLLAPFVAIAAFGRGFSPSSLLWDVPQNIPVGLEEFQPAEAEYHGPLRLRTAIANDYLTPIAKLLVDMGAFNVWRMSQVFGLPDLSRSQNPEALLYGGGKATILEIAQSYATLANQGRQIGKAPATPKSEAAEGSPQRPSGILWVEDLTHRRWWEARAPQEKLVLSPQLSFLIHHILSDDNARRATLGFPNALQIGRPAAAKIGQTADGHQVWSVGYTPQRLTVVWLGLPPHSDPNLRLDPKMAAGVWHAVMQYSHRELPVIEWEQPSGISIIKVCDPSGLLPTPACPAVVEEVFLQGNEPTTFDNLYRTYEVNRETQLLATVFTPLEMIEERTYLIPPPEFSSWAKEVGLAIPPQSYDTIQPPPSSPDARITYPPLFAYVAGEVKIRGSAAGEMFSAYRLQVGAGLNPRSWQQIGADATAPRYNDVLGIWDTRQQRDGLYALRLLVIRSDQSIQSAITQVTVDNTPPVIQSFSPSDSQKISLSASSVNLEAFLTDAVGIDRVIWYVDGKQTGEALQPPYVYLWEAKRGKHTLQVKAVDLAGNETLSEKITFNVE